MFFYSSRWHLLQSDSLFLSHYVCILKLLECVGSGFRCHLWIKSWVDFILNFFLGWMCSINRVTSSKLHFFFGFARIFIFCWLFSWNLCRLRLVGFLSFRILSTRLFHFLFKDISTFNPFSPFICCSSALYPLFFFFARWSFIVFYAASVLLFWLATTTFSGFF